MNEARQALRESYLHALRALEVEQAGDSIVISGQVTSYYQKQMAQEIVRAVCQDIELQNVVDVKLRKASS